MEDFANVEVYSGGSGLMHVPSNKDSALMTSDQTRAISEVQAAMVIAQRFPRDENAAYLKIINACKRKTLAAVSTYAYRRGGTLVEGPSIRIMETLLRCWGNSVAGFTELSRSNGKSEVEAYAWDLETNTKFSRKFTVRHIRDKKTGNEDITDERSIYELVANMAQRRVRACIQQIVPGDIVEAAIDQCKRTLTDGERPTADRARDMLVAFGGLGVTKDMIEAWLSHKVSAIVPAQLLKLQQIYMAIKDGVAPREEYFDMTAGKPELSDEPPPVEEPETTKRGPGRPPKMREPGEDE